MPLESLLALEPYAPHTEETESLFKKALGARLRAHMEGNPLYADFLRRKGFDPSKPFELENIPFLPARLFKILGARLATVPEKEISQHLTSSATSGIPSTVPLSRSGAQAQRRCMAQTMAQFIGKKRRPFLILDTDPALAARSGSYGARGAAVRGYMTFASKSAFFMKESAEGLVFDQDAFIEAIENADPGIPLIIFGFTYILYSHVAQALRSAGKNFHLPQGSQILHIGGWKKLENEKISRENFLELISGLFGVEKSAIIDVYGFTEQMGLNYPDCACGFKHAPHMSRVLARDPLTLKALPHGKPGLLEFISPLPASYAGSAVLTDDVGIIEDGACPCGRGGQRFRVIGRLPKAEPRGCGDIMGEKMRKPRQSMASAASGALRIHSWPANANDMPSLIRQVRAGGEWLREQKFEDLVGLVSTVASSWDQNPNLSHWRHQGLSFLGRWCSAPNLRALARQGARGMVGALDEFTPEPGREKHLLRAMPVGLVAHWLSGNVPFLAFLLLSQSILAKNCNILKTASNNLDAIKTLLDTFQGAAYINPAGKIIRGDDLLSSIGLVHYSHNDMEPALTLSRAANARIAWGGREAIDAICSLESRAETVDLVFGPKSSFMAIAKESIADEKSLHKILRRAASDVSSFDQAACSSPHTIFVERGGFAAPVDFARMLGDYLEKNLALIPKNPEDDPTIAAIQTARSVGEFMGQCWHSEGPGWTVIYDERQELATPTYSRVITVRPVEELMDASKFARDGIQTVGLAAEGEKRLAFAEACAARGALRFPEIGAMTLFDSPWDGMFAMDRLLRWISLGGSASVIARA